ncbi:MAG: FkbM family methyltransferase [Candidatus Levybacteria bacterium]|nr:FkbM family methyltransferase [Candidatus Levybacteria bacterium]
MIYIKSVIEILRHPLNENRKLKVLIFLIWWKVNQYLFKLPSFIQITPEAKCICYPNSSYGGLVLYMILPEYPQMNFVYRVLNNNDVFVDIGANIGVYSLIAASKITKGKIFAFEPTKEMLKIFYENIHLNNFSEKIKVIEKAVSDTNTPIHFTVSNISDTNHISYGKYDEKNSISVNSTTIDHFLKINNIDHIDMLKIDVEGAELKVLKGAKKSLKEKRISYILLEINTCSKLFNSYTVESLEFLTKYDYIIYFFDKNNKMQKIDNFKDLENKTMNVLAINNKKEINKSLNTRQRFTDRSTLLNREA